MKQRRLVPTVVLACIIGLWAGDAAGTPSIFYGVVATSRDGGWYVILQPGENWDFRLFRRLPKNGPRAPFSTSDWPSNSDTPPRLLEPDSGDTLVASGRCPLSAGITCLSGGKGFVSWGSFQSPLTSNTLGAYYDGKGIRRWILEYSDPRIAPRTSGGAGDVDRSFVVRWWMSRDELFIVLALRDLRAVAFELSGGTVVPLSRDVVQDRVVGGNLSELLDVVLAPDIAAEPWLSSLAEAQVAARSQADTLRLPFLMFLARRGQESARAALVSALAPSATDINAPVLPRLGECLGSRAGTILRDALLGGEHIWRRAAEGLAGLDGEAEYLALDLAETDQSAVVRLRALGALELRPGLGSPALIRVAKLASARDEVISPAAVRLLTHQQGDTAASILSDLLLAGGPGYEQIVTYFQRFPRRTAVPALITALSRFIARRETFWAENAVSALQAATKQQLGADVAAWRRWWDQEPK